MSNTTELIANFLQENDITSLKYTVKYMNKATTRFIDIIVSAIMVIDQKAYDALSKYIVNVDELDKKHGSTMLMHACQNGMIDAVTDLIARGATVGYTNDKGKNALYYACIDNVIDYKCMITLLLNGADPEVTFNMLRKFGQITVIKTLKKQIDRFEYTKMALAKYTIQEPVVQEPVIQEPVVQEQKPKGDTSKYAVYQSKNGEKYELPARKTIKIEAICSLEENMAFPPVDVCKVVTNKLVIRILKEGKWIDGTVILYDDVYVDVVRSDSILAAFHVLPAGIELDGVITNESYRVQLPLNTCSIMYGRHILYDCRY